MSGQASTRTGWGLLAVVTLLVLASWLPSLGAAFGDSHEGRILARHALNVQNAQQDGLAASGWLSDWSPYAGDGGEQTSYAHHPPLLNFGYYITGQLLAGGVLDVGIDVAMRVFAYLMGIAALPLGAALLRRLGMGWPGTLLATTAIALTPLFWVYGRLSGNVSLLLAMTLCVVRLREEREVAPAELAVAAVVSFAAVVAGYLGLATAALLGLWLLARRGPDRVTVVVGVAMVLAAAVSLGYVVGSTGGGRIGEQLQLRTAGGDFTAREFLARIEGWTAQLLPGLWRWLVVPVGLVAAVVDRRTRVLGMLLVVVAAGYVFGLPNGSYIHDYWIFPVLLPVWLGLGALADRVLDRVLDRVPRAGPVPVAVAGLTVVAVLGAGGLVVGDVGGRYFADPEAAGAVARSTTPPAGQSVAWRTAGVAAPRWLSLYWDLPPGQLAAGDVGDPGDDELVFVPLEATPGWLGDAADVEAVAEEVAGRYAVVRGATLRRLAAAAG